MYICRIMYIYIYIYIYYIYICPGLCRKCMNMPDSATPHRRVMACLPKPQQLTHSRLDVQRHQGQWSKGAEHIRVDQQGTDD